MKKIHNGIGKHLREGEFAGLDPACRKKLLTLMARVAENTYRRGLQHGYLFRDKNWKLNIKPDALRWGQFSLDLAPMPVCGTKHSTSLTRLKCQHSTELLELGFREVLDNETN